MHGISIYKLRYTIMNIIRLFRNGQKVRATVDTTIMIDHIFQTISLASHGSLMSIRHPTFRRSDSTGIKAAW